MNRIQEPPDGIIITISAGMLKEKGILNWTRNFKRAMDSEGWSYWFRQGAKPKYDILYVYLCILGRVRYRINYVGSETGFKKFLNDGEGMYAKVWLITCGPLVEAPQKIPMKGFRGFRYTEFLF